MNNKFVSEQALKRENDSLKDRLEEAEETLRAIRSGEIDAIIVSGSNGEHVFTIQGAETPYRILIEDMQEGALSISAEGTILYANLHFSQMVENSLDTLVGSSIFDYVTSEKLRLEDILQRAESSSVKEEINLGPINGKLIPVYLSASPLLEGSNGRMGLVVTDLTTQKLHEESVASERVLRESEKKFRELADTLPQIVWAADSAGRVDYFNRRWYEFTQSEEIRGSVRQIMHPEDMEKCRAAWLNAVHTGIQYDIEYRFKDIRTGEFLWHLGRALPVRDHRERIVRWYGTSTNIHAQKKAEAERDKLLASERSARNVAEAASRMKDNFLTTLSHELRTPLNSILGYAQLIRKKGIRDLHFLEQGVLIIERNAKAQAELISDLLDMSGIVSGKVKLAVENIDLPVLVEEVLASMRLAVDAKGLKLFSKQSKGVGKVAGDSTRLRQIFWNLLSNAIKFTPSGGEITVSMQLAESQSVISVQDTGSGIDRDFLPYVFDSFRQADGTTSRKFGGLGLGLSIVRHLTELHGGTVSVESQGLNLGSTFIVKLPLISTKNVNSRKESKSQPDFSDDGSQTDPAEPRLFGIKVLVVDDEPDARSLLTEILSQCKAEVISASSSHEALKMLSAEKPDILISDIGMPGEDGYQLISRIRALSEEEGGQIPAVALTAFARSEDRKKALLAGFQVHLSKPVEPDELAFIVSSLSKQALRVTL